MAATQRIPAKNEAGARSTIDDGLSRVDPTLSADGMMPDPLSGATNMSKADADDLIASIADQQIDAMLGDDEAGNRSDVEPTQNAAELAVNATQDLQAVAEELTAQASADLMSDLSKAAQAALEATPASDIIADATNEALGSTNQALGATKTKTNNKVQAGSLPQDEVVLSQDVADRVNTSTPTDVDAALASGPKLLEAKAATIVDEDAVVSHPSDVRIAGDVTSAVDAVSIAAEPVLESPVALTIEAKDESSATPAASIEVADAESIAVDSPGTDANDAPDLVADDLNSKTDAPSTDAQHEASADSSVPVDAAALTDLNAVVPAADASEINQDEIDALITGGSEPLPVEPPSENAPSHAADVAHAFDAAPTHESSADAVAREMAEDARHALADLPTMDVPPPPANRTLAAFQTAVMLVLTWVNLPIRHLSDGARELIGIVGIVTLVNAMALLLYLMIFG